jgi:hypothetical protein
VTQITAVSARGSARQGSARALFAERFAVTDAEAFAFDYR